MLTVRKEFATYIQFNIIKECKYHSAELCVYMHLQLHILVPVMQLMQAPE